MKIKSIQQLKAEKKTLTKRQAELEKAIRYDWRDVKDSLLPQSFASLMLSKVAKEKEKSPDSFLSTLAASLAKNAMQHVEGKLFKWLKK